MPVANWTSFGMSTTTGPGRPVCGDMEGLVDERGELVDVLHQPVVLGAGPRDADGVAFLEGVGADQRGRHLTGQADQRNANPSARPAAASPRWWRPDLT